MNLIIYIYIFLIGICLGSFYACIGFRIPNKISLTKQKSFCPNCKKELKWYMNIPLISFIIQKGKCKYCNTKISSFYFIIELLTGISFVVSYYFYNFTIDFFMLIILISALNITIVTDLKYYYISDRVIVISVLLELILYLYFKINIIPYLLSSITMFIMIYIVKLIGDKAFKTESLGGGDIKLMILMGFTLGFASSLISLLISSILALFVSLLLKKKKNEIIPFGPFILLSTIIMYVINIYNINLLF